MKKQIKKYGYVIEIRTKSANPKFYQKEVGIYYGLLRTAEVLSRDMAYMLRYDNETVRKVELSKNGKPKRVVTR